MSEQAEKIQISCPSCGSKLTGPAKLRGRALKCPKCQGQIVVPNLEPQPSGADETGVEPLNSSLLDELPANSDLSNIDTEGGTRLRQNVAGPKRISRRLSFNLPFQIQSKRKATIAAMVAAWVLLTLLGLLFPHINAYIGGVCLLAGFACFVFGTIAALFKLVAKDPGEFFKYTAVSLIAGGYLASKTLDKEKAARRGQESAGIAGTIVILGIVMFFAGMVNLTLAVLTHKAQIEAKSAVTHVSRSLVTDCGRPHARRPYADSSNPNGLLGSQRRMTSVTSRACFCFSSLRKHLMRPRADSKKSRLASRS